MKIVDLNTCKNGGVDGYEALSVTLPELEDVSSFLSNPDVPLILPEDITVGRSIGKGATGIVRSGIWKSLYETSLSNATFSHELSETGIFLWH